MKLILLFVRLLNIKLLLGGLAGFLIGHNALAQAPDFGNDSSQWIYDGECDDPRFQGSGMAEVLLGEDRFSDATDCRLLFNQGRITLSLRDSSNIDFGNDSSQWIYDGECDDPRFQGSGMAEVLLGEDRFSDATDCRLLFNQGRITLRGSASPEANNIETSSGTGFFVSRDGYILTNQHVIDGCQEVQVNINDARHGVSVIAADRVNDLALLKSELIPSAIFPISREIPSLLQDIYVAGYPFGDEISTSVKVTAGIVSSLSGIGDNESNIQIDAALQPGNSGGPIIDQFGNAIGVAVEKLSYEYIMELYDAIPENTNFGIKASVAANLLDANNVSAIQPNYSPMSKEALGRRIIDGTVYVSCLG